MTQSELTFRSQYPPDTQNGRLAAILAKHPGEWLPMTDLGREIGAWAVHSRVADLRRLGMAIEHKNERRTNLWGVRSCHSYYRFVP